MATRKPIASNVQSVFGALGSLNVSGVAIEMDAEGFKRRAYIDARDIDKLHDNIKSFREPLQMSLDQVVVPAIIKNFAAQGRPPWVALKDSTIQRRSWRPTTASKGRHAISTSVPVGGGHFRILDNTGRLKKAATQKNMWDIKEDQLTFRSTFFSGKVPYGAFHQLGTRNMVERVFISLRYDEEEKIQDVFSDWLLSRINKYWTMEVFRE